MSPRRKSTTRLGDKLAGLRDVVLAAHTRRREIEVQADTARREPAALREALTEAYARGEEEAAAQLVENIEAAEVRAAEPWAERIAGAARAARRAEADRDEFIRANYDGLVAEREAGALAIVDTLREHVQQVRDDMRAWTAEAQEQRDLLAAIPGRDGRELPEVSGLEQLVRDVARQVEALLPPLPRGQASAVVLSPDTVAALEEAIAHG